MAESFPRQYARTRRFTQGAPRSFRLAESSPRALFCRSVRPGEHALALWELDWAGGQVVETMILDPGRITGDRSLPPEELARRERLRESGEGIVSFDADPELERSVFTFDGALFAVDVPQRRVRELEAPTGVFDPRLCRDGSHVAFVAERSLWVLGIEGDDRARRLVGPDTDEDTVSWGVAEFVAAEEMGRMRGHWWSPDGAWLAVCRVDESPVETWWLSNPVDPTTEPRPVRYPAAGTDNTLVELHLLGLDGTDRVVDWVGDHWEYLVDVVWSEQGLLVVVADRSQREIAILDVDPSTGTVSERHRIADEVWVEPVPGTPAFAGERLVTVEDRGGARRLVLGGDAVTPDGLYVRRVVSASDDGVVFEASADPCETHIYRVRDHAPVEAVTDGSGLHHCVASALGMIVTSASLDRHGATAAVVAPDGAPLGTITSHAETPVVNPEARIEPVTEHELRSVVLLPHDHDGSPLPVLLDPYGGPHAQRVVASRAAFCQSQWFADQGFAVVVVDGRGTPGRDPEFERAVRGDLAGPVLDDQIAALRELAQLHPELDLDRVAIRGWSFGGYLAALAVLRRPDVFHAAIAGAPVTDWRLYDTHYTERYLGHPEVDPDPYERTSLIGDAHRLERPLMLIHGLVDDNVVVAHTLALSRALLEAGRPHEVLPLSGVTHMTPQETVAEHLLELQLGFLRRTLG